MPTSTQKMAAQLGLPASWDRPLPEVLQWGRLTPKTALSQGKALFPRLE
jgi:methionyl-tRNA synthetase